MRLTTEVWAKAKSIRAISVAKDNGNISVKLAWGTSLGEHSFERDVSVFGLITSTLGLLSTSGTERWFWRLTREAALKKIEDFRKSAKSKGFTKVGTFTV